MLFGTKEAEPDWTIGDFLKRFQDEASTSARAENAKKFLVRAHADDSSSFNVRDLESDFRDLADKLDEALRYETPVRMYKQSVWLNLRVCKVSIEALKGGVDKEENTKRYRRCLQRIVAINAVLLPHQHETDVAIRFMRQGPVPVMEAWDAAKALAESRETKSFTSAEYEDWANHIVRHVTIFNEETFDQLTWIECRLSQLRKV